MNEGELYLGPPGTGKTQNLSNLIRKCIEDGIPPDRIACVSFTKRAAIESKERVGRDWGIEESDLLWVFLFLIKETRTRIQILMSSVSLKGIYI